MYNVYNVTHPGIPSNFSVYLHRMLPFSSHMYVKTKTLRPRHLFLSLEIWFIIDQITPCLHWNPIFIYFYHQWPVITCVRGTSITWLVVDTHCCNRTIPFCSIVLYDGDIFPFPQLNISKERKRWFSTDADFVRGNPNQIHSSSLPCASTTPTL